MAKIRELPPEVQTRIAAGEVIERPASVLKELIENSIDAGASEIDIVLEKAGKNLIRISDNGSGMDENDLLVAYLPHTTSKLSSLDDLEGIRTLGFRGEALASIASVSHLRIESRSEGEEIGTYIEVEGRQLLKKGKLQHKKGTTVEVKRLFYNIPVRRRFLKSDSTELAWILDIINQFSLAYPEIAFILYHEKKELLRLEKTKNLAERIERVLKIKINNFIFIEHYNPIFKLKAWFSRPEISYPDRKAQFFYVNRRAVRSSMLYHLVSSAYREILPPNRHLQLIFMLEIEPKLVDVNIHPTKREVKFRREKEIYDILLNVLKENLTAPKVIRETGKSFYQEEIKEREIPLQENQLSLSQLKYQEEKASFLYYKDTFIIFIRDDKINIIDQHSAHEHILFEKLMANINGQLPEKEKLLLPEIIDLNPAQAIRVRQNILLLNKCGIEMEEFGENSFILRAKPTWLKQDIKKFLQDVILELEEDNFKELEEQKKKLCASLACHAAVKKGDRLSIAEAEKLIQDITKTKIPYCPHGRPAIITIDLKKIEKEFLR